ncbi:MAG TPA: Lrp/AsnC family transcriptional regulator [Methylomirabilota bacterium]|jgi:Lrp/AsnC family leucine-responsive transcriptional regulator
MSGEIERLLDTVGWDILGALQDNARLSFSELGRRVGLSAPAAAERVKRMEDAGIIRGYRLEIGFEPLGLPIAALIRVSAPEEKCPGLTSLVKSLPEVLECHHVTGSDSFVLKVVTESVGHLEAVIAALGRWGTPTTSIILSSPVVARGVAAPPTAWPLRKAAARGASPATSARAGGRERRAR